MALGYHIGLSLGRPSGGGGPPVITTSATASVAENAKLAIALTSNQAVTWSIVGGVDAAAYEISGTTLRWDGDGTQDYEDPQDDGADNTYVVEVEALNAETGLYSVKAITTTVTNVLEVTLAALGGTFTLREDAEEDDVAGALTGMTAGSTLALLDDAGGRVALSGTNIVSGPTGLDYEADTSHDFTVRETHPDANNSPRDTELTLTVTRAPPSGYAFVLNDQDGFVLNSSGGRVLAKVD